MKKLIISIVLLNSVLVNLAQTTSDVGKIALSIIMPEKIDGLEDSQLSKLETKITNIV